MDEHSIIKNFFSDIGASFIEERGILVSAGDDAALIEPSLNKLAISSDTSIEGVHFLSSMDPRDIAYRSVAIALSDLAASGAEPIWFMLNLNLPDFKETWLNSFKKGLQDISTEYQIPLIGGDTCKGDLVISVQVAGLIQKENFLKRTGARKGDSIFVSGNIGEAYRGLKQYNQSKIRNKAVSAYLRPKARISLGKEISSFASSAIDISDGLIADLNHICKSSGVGAELFFDLIPSSSSITLDLDSINQGDDYELCFTVDKLNETKVSRVANSLNLKITKIGNIIDGDNVTLFSSENKKIEPPEGFNHF